LSILQKQRLKFKVLSLF